MSAFAESDVVVIGGGVIGVACAYYLARQGQRVTVIDRGTIGGGCSAGNCGYVCPSHVLPLAAPGAITKTLKALLATNSPLKVTPGFLLKNMAWFLGFARRCHTDAMHEAALGIQALLNSSRQLYEELISIEQIDCEWDTHGLLFVFRTKKAHEHHAEINEMLKSRYCMPAVRYDGESLRELEPALLPGSVAGGWHYTSDAQLRPDVLMKSWRNRLEEQYRVRFIEYADFRGFAPLHAEAQAVCTSRGDFRAKQFVVALGAWTNQIQQSLGTKLPILPGKGYSLTMPTPANAPKYPMIFEEDSVAVSPFQSGYRIGSTMEFSGYSAEINPLRLQLLRTGAAKYLPEVNSTTLEPWVGLRPMVYDGNPIIDFTPQFRNVLVAAGHGMLGLSMATATGKLVAELLTNTNTHIDRTHYSLSRFKRY